MTSLCDCCHHAVRANDNQAIHLIQSDLLFAKFAFGISLYSVYDISHIAKILRAARTKAWGFIAAPNNLISSCFNLSNFVAILKLDVRLKTKTNLVMG